MLAETAHRPPVDTVAALTGLILAACLTAASLVLGVSSVPDTGGEPVPKILRLHIIANSDSREDQDLKLRVRDRVVWILSQDLSDSMTRDEARWELGRRLVALEAAAEDEIAAAGFEYPVRTELGWFDFDQRVQGETVYPAGRYEALRVVIGQGAGANWWSVLFPPMGFLDTVGGLAVQAPEAGKPSVGAVASESRVTVRWAIADWLKSR